MRVVRLRRNFGKAAALQAGFEEAQGDVVVTIDGDLQDDPAEIPRLLAKLDEGFDLVSGWKTKRRDPLTRRIPSRIFNRVTGRLSGLRLHDLNCGLKAYRAEVRPAGSASTASCTASSPCSPTTAASASPSCRSTTARASTDARATGWSATSAASSTCSRSRSWAATGTGRCISSAASACCSARSARSLLVYLTVLKLTGEAIGQRPLLTLGVLLVVVGVQLVSLGLVSELVASHHEERTGGRQPRAARGRDPALSLRVLYFGTYERDYPRNAQVISCLRGAGVEVIERHASVWERRRHKWSLGLAAALRIGLAETRLLFGGRRERFDAVIVGYPGHFDVPAGASGSRADGPVLFNPLVSLHETLVEDRGRFAAGSPAAGVLRQVDRLALRRADLVVADTAQNARHLAELAELARRTARGLLRRRRGAALPARVAARSRTSTRSSSAS